VKDVKKHQWGSSKRIGVAFGYILQAKDYSFMIFSSHMKYVQPFQTCYGRGRNPKWICPVICRHLTNQTADEILKKTTARPNQSAQRIFLIRSWYSILFFKSFVTKLGIEIWEFIQQGNGK